MYISFLKTTDIRFKDGMRDEKYADESTLSERVFDVSKGSNLNPKEATSPRSVWTRTCHDTRAIFFPIRREIESVFRPFANVSFSLITWTRKLMRLCSKIWNVSTVYKLKIRFNNLIRRIISMIRRISLQINPSLWQKDSFWNWFHVYAWKSKTIDDSFPKFPSWKGTEKFNKENHLKDLRVCWKSKLIGSSN